MTIQYHEPPESLEESTRDVHRVLATLCEEMEAIDWYQQRIDVAQDAESREIFEHNRNEEMEHASMAIEWLRRRIPAFDKHLKTYLFSEGPIARESRDIAARNGAVDRGLGIGSLRPRQPERAATKEDS